jgi:outer membrane protein assembly factor BamB
MGSGELIWERRVERSLGEAGSLAIDVEGNLLLGHNRGVARFASDDGHLPWNFETESTEIGRFGVDAVAADPRGAVYVAGDKTRELVLMKILPPADFDSDGDVDGDDFLIWQASFETDTGADADGDGDTDGDDFLLWQIGYVPGDGGLAAIAARVPEPTTLVLLIAATLGAAALRC